MSSVSSFDSKVELIKTPAEREREQSLLDDPYARVLGPSNVQCKQCLKKIKLSSKSAYDTFHWRNHRARCLKAMKKKAKSADLTVKRPLHSPPLSKAANPQRPLQKAKPPKTPTPPLVSDSDDERRSEPCVEAQSPPAPTNPPHYSFPPLKEYVAFADTNIEEYMLRSHPECVSSLQSISSGDNGRNWSWSQLKQPHFSAPVYYDDGDDGEEDEGNSVASSLDRSRGNADEREQDAARTLSMLFQSRG